MKSLGIDIGYSAIKFVLINEDFKVLEDTYILHKGRIKEEIKRFTKQLIRTYGEQEIEFGALTGQGSKLISEKLNMTWINETTSLVEGSRSFSESVQSVFEIGGQSSKYVTNLHESCHANIIISINSNCAAGTGSFLEEQVSRLGINLKDYSALVADASFVPRIAGRCSVFAKTDIIHHQQEGTKVNDILLGLAYSLVKNYKANVVKKHPIQKPILFTGGVAHNDAIVRALQDVFKLKAEDIIIPANCGNIAALGAAILGYKNSYPVYLKNFNSLWITEENETKGREDVVKLKPLSNHGVIDSAGKHDCIVVGLQPQIKGYLGLDIGSTSTNVVLTDQDSNVIGFQYLRTLGDPIAAVKKGLLGIQKEIGKEIEVLGVGTTGSGRYLAGKLVGADIVVDEITAQAKAAHRIDNDVDTIIEIGGQDSKFIRLQNGVVSDFEMNKICAAGTGSFIEEQAKKLNITIHEFANLAMSSENPLDLGDRCTVFIESNIAACLSNEAKLEDIAAGLSYSIVKNYLNKVVGHKQIGKKVFFQGGVAYNQAVVNAFRSLLGEFVQVPAFFSVTGAYGAALIAKDEVQGSTSLFKGFDFGGNCELDTSKSSHTPKESCQTKVFQQIEEYYLEGYDKEFDSRKKIVGIPRVLFLHKLFPLFNTFFKELGFNVVLSGKSDDRIIELSQEFSMDETCYPVKLINGHVAQLIEKGVDYIFLPSLHTMAHAVSTTRQNYGCVFMQCSPKLINKTMELDAKGITLLSPELSFNFGKEYLMKTLIQLGTKLGRSKAHTALAITKGMMSLKKFEQKTEKLGEETIKSLGKDEKAFVIITRNYGISDPVLNMGIPEKIEKLGYKVLTLSNLPVHDHDTSREHPNMYWPFGQHILSGAQIVRQHPNLYAIYLTNHGCGQDTVLNHYFKEEMKGKPYLNIEVDEHFSSVGVLTRVEAFINSLKSEKVEQSSETLTLWQYSEKVVHKTINVQGYLDGIDETMELYLPHLYPYTHLIASYLTRKGYKAKVLPETTNQTLDLGRKHTLSKEYFSLTCLVGDVLTKASLLEKNNQSNYGFLIPTAEGSEVDGQYYRLLRDKLDGASLNQSKIIAPFIEDLIKDSGFAPDLFLILLGGDLINLGSNHTRPVYFRKVTELIQKNALSIDHLIELAKEIQKNRELNNSKKIFVLGEINVLFNDFMNNRTLVTLENQGIEIIRAPLSEYMWFIWRDYLSQKNNKKETLAINNLKQFADYIKRVSKVLNWASPFENEPEDLVKRADKFLGLYTGGDGRYRYAKVLGGLNDASGIITVSSMYENTNTILNILATGTAVSSVPILNLTFDGNENEIEKSKLDAFMYYALQEAKRGA